jgi:hypothetical protein
VSSSFFGDANAAHFLLSFLSLLCVYLSVSLVFAIVMRRVCDLSITLLVWCCCDAKRSLLEVQFGCTFVTHSSDLIMSSEYSTEEEHERLRKVLENKPLHLWRLFREALLNGGACRDIVEKHVMCKLNGTDLKFFYDVNTETRKLIKRSSRASDLKKKFKVKEMSSVSTLEFAWEHKSLWPSYWEDETNFCENVAETNKLELLKWAREEKNVSGMDGRFLRPHVKVIWK